MWSKGMDVMWWWEPPPPPPQDIAVGESGRKWRFLPLPEYGGWGEYSWWIWIPPSSNMLFVGPDGYQTASPLLLSVSEAYSGPNSCWLA